MGLAGTDSPELHTVPVDSMSPLVPGVAALPSEAVIDNLSVCRPIGSNAVLSPSPDPALCRR